MNEEEGLEVQRLPQATSVTELLLCMLPEAEKSVGIWEGEGGTDVVVTELLE